MHNYTKGSSLIISQSIEAVARTCAVKKVFLEMQQNSQGNTCAGKKMQIDETLSQKLHVQCVRMTVKINQNQYEQKKKDTSKATTKDNQQINNSIQNNPVHESSNNKNANKNVSLTKSSNMVHDSRQDSTLTSLIKFK